MMYMLDSKKTKSWQVQQRFYRIYEPSPDLSREVLVKLFKKASKYLNQPEKIVEFLGKHDVRGISQELRRIGIMASAMDIFNVLEKLRQSGYLRVVGTRRPEKKVEMKEIKKVTGKVVMHVPSPIPPPQAIGTKAEAPLVEAPSVDSSIIDIVSEKKIQGPVRFPETVEVQAIPVQHLKAEIVLPPHLDRIVGKVREAQVFERYMDLNEFINAIILISREANIILHSVYKNINIPDATLLAFFVTICDHADRATSTLDLGEFKETIVEADLNFIMLSKLKYEVVLAAIFDRKIALGLMIRDFLALKREVLELI